MFVFYWNFYYFRNVMRNILTILGNIPVTSSVIASLFPEVKTKLQKSPNWKRQVKSSALDETCSL